MLVWMFWTQWAGASVESASHSHHHISSDWYEVRLGSRGKSSAFCFIGASLHLRDRAPQHSPKAKPEHTMEEAQLRILLFGHDPNLMTKGETDESVRWGLCILAQLVFSMTAVSSSLWTNPQTAGAKDSSLTQAEHLSFYLLPWPLNSQELLH